MRPSRSAFFAFSRRAPAIMAPPAGPMPLLLSLRTSSAGALPMNSSLGKRARGRQHRASPRHHSSCTFEQTSRESEGRCDAHGFCAAAAEGIVGEVERSEVGEREERGAEEAEGLGDLGDEAAGEDVGKVGDLRDARVSGVSVGRGPRATTRRGRRQQCGEVRGTRLQLYVELEGVHTAARCPRPSGSSASDHSTNARGASASSRARERRPRTRRRRGCCRRSGPRRGRRPGQSRRGRAASGRASRA